MSSGMHVGLLSYVFEVFLVYPNLLTQYECFISQEKSINIDVDRQTKLRLKMILSTKTAIPTPTLNHTHRNKNKNDKQIHKKRNGRIETRQIFMTFFLTAPAVVMKTFRLKFLILWRRARCQKFHILLNIVTIKKASYGLVLLVLIAISVSGCWNYFPRVGSFTEAPPHYKLVVLML